jgi:hypothetical protein
MQRGCAVTPTEIAPPRRRRPRRSAAAAASGGGAPGSSPPPPARGEADSLVRSMLPVVLLSNDNAQIALARSHGLPALRLAGSPDLDRGVAAQVGAGAGGEGLGLGGLGCSWGLGACGCALPLAAARLGFPGRHPVALAF